MQHYLIDAYRTTTESTGHLMSVNECLARVADSLSLKPVMPPFLIPYYYTKIKEDGGISAFMLLEGGHVSIHTFPYRQCYFADILCDGSFDVRDAESELQHCFYAKTVKSRSIDRTMVGHLEAPNYNTLSDFGPHYMIGVRDIDLTFESIFHWLDTLAPKIKMEAISRPYVIYSTTKKPKYISGFIVVAQSHVSVHYNISERQAFIDIFSCCFLEHKHIEAVLNESFVDKYECTLLVRGSKYRYSNIGHDKGNRIYSSWQSFKNKV